jgi:hypothetical protein
MTKISLEQGKTKIVACSLEWPGWCRFGKTQETALTALLDSAPRYRVIAERAGVDVAPEAFVVVERVGGDATTDWDAPSLITTTDTHSVDGASATAVGKNIEP